MQSPLSNQFHFGWPCYAHSCQWQRKHEQIFISLSVISFWRFSVEILVSFSFQNFSFFQKMTKYHLKLFAKTSASESRKISKIQEDLARNSQKIDISTEYCYHFITSKVRISHLKCILKGPDKKVWADRKPSRIIFFIKKNFLCQKIASQKVLSNKITQKIIIQAKKIFEKYTP